MVSLAIPVFNFKVCVDAQLVKGGDKVVYGVCFRRIKDSNGLSCYQFIFNSGSYCLLLWRNGEYKFLLEYRSCEFIRQDSINSLMVQMRGQEITLGINEHILDTITDTSLALPSYAGISVSKPEHSRAEVRFRNFRLYSLE